MALKPYGYVIELRRNTEYPYVFWKRSRVQWSRQDAEKVAEEWQKIVKDFEYLKNSTTHIVTLYAPKLEEHH